MVENKKSERYVARDEGGALSLFDVKPECIEGVWLPKADNRGRATKSYEISPDLLPEVTYNNSPMKVVFAIQSPITHHCRTKEYKITKIERAGYKVYRRGKIVTLTKGGIDVFKGSVSKAHEFVFGYR